MNEVGMSVVFFVVLVIAPQAAILGGAAFAARASIAARERLGRPLVGWEPTLCGMAGAVLVGTPTALLALQFFGVAPIWSSDSLSGPVFLAAGEGAFIGLWVALCWTVGPSQPPSSSRIDGKAGGEHREPRALTYAAADERLRG